MKLMPSAVLLLISLFGMGAYAGLPQNMTCSSNSSVDLGNGRTQVNDPAITVKDSSAQKVFLIESSANTDGQARKAEDMKTGRLYCTLCALGTDAVTVDSSVGTNSYAESVAVLDDVGVAQLKAGANSPSFLFSVTCK